MYGRIMFFKLRALLFYKSKPTNADAYDYGCYSGLKTFDFRGFLEAVVTFVVYKYFMGIFDILDACAEFSMFLALL